MKEGRKRTEQVMRNSCMKCGHFKLIRGNANNNANGKGNRGLGMGMGEVSEWNASVSCLCTVCGPFSQVNLLTLSLSLSLCDSACDFRQIGRERRSES